MKRILYKNNEYTLLKAGKHADDTPYIELEPDCEELSSRMCAEIHKKGTLSVWIGGGGRQKLMLGDEKFDFYR